MDSRLFGEGRETIEMMIVRVAGEYADAPGVRRVGLSATQWRCLFQALIKQESRFSVTAESPVGAYGLTQLMPGTASDMGIDRYDVMDNCGAGRATSRPSSPPSGPFRMRSRPTMQDRVGSWNMAACRPSPRRKATCGTSRASTTSISL